MKGTRARKEVFECRSWGCCCCYSVAMVGMVGMVVLCCVVLCCVVDKSNFMREWKKEGVTQISFVTRGRAHNHSMCEEKFRSKKSRHWHASSTVEYSLAFS